MARSTWTGATIVYRYGCPSWADLPEEAMAQLRLAHELRNDLVAVEYRYREIVDGIWSLHPEVAQAQTAVVEATAEIERVVEQVKAERRTDRTTVARQGTKQSLANARAARRDAKAAAKAAKQEALATQRPLLAEAAQARYDAITQCRADAVERGLFWPTATDIKKNNDTAAKLIAQAWKQGRSAQRRFRRWDGTGTLTTQVQRQAGKPVRSPSLLASGEGPYRNVVQVRPWCPDAPTSRGAHRFGRLSVRLSKGDEPVTLPIVIHRPLPAEADVTDVRITRSRVAGHYLLSVALTVHLPLPAPKTGGDAVAVRVGWSSLGDGWLRVATVATAGGPLGDPPAYLADVVRVSDTCTEILVHPSWRDMLIRDDKIRSHRDDLVDALRPQVVAALTDPDLSAAVGETAATVAKWRAFHKFVRLARAWPAEHPLAADLEAWRQRDKHLWEYESHERRQVIARRRDTYRKVVAWICEQASSLAVSGLDIAEVKQRPAVGVEDSYEERQARHNAQVAAPGEFRAVLEQAAQRRGIEVVRE